MRGESDAAQHITLGVALEDRRWTNHGSVERRRRRRRSAVIDPANKMVERRVQDMSKRDAAVGGVVAVGTTDLSRRGLMTRLKRRDPR